MTNKICSAFESVKATPRLKAETLKALEIRRRKAGTGARKAVLALACCCVLLLLALGAYRFWQVPVSFVSIDVNPSVELGLNHFDRIVCSKAYNREGEAVLQGLSLHGKLYTEAIDLLLDSREMEPYLADPSSALVITVAAGEQAKEDALLAGVRSGTGCQSHGGESQGGNISLLEEAHGCGMSLGKYTAYQELSQYDETVTPEDCQRMTMGQLQERIRQCHHGQGSMGHHGGAGNSEASAQAPESAVSSQTSTGSSGSLPCYGSQDCGNGGQGYGNGGQGYGNGGQDCGNDSQDCWDNSQDCWDDSQDCWDDSQDCWDGSQDCWDGSQDCWDGSQDCWDGSQDCGNGGQGYGNGHHGGGHHGRR